MIARALTGIGKECLTTIFLGIETRLLRNRISLLMTTLRFKWSIQYNHKILSPSGCVVWVIFQSSSDRSSSPIARSASTVALRLGLRRQRTERFLIYTLQRHEHVQRGSVPQLGWSWRVWQRATGPTPPSRSPKRPFVRVDELWRPNF